MLLSKHSILCSRKSLLETGYGSSRPYPHDPQSSRQRVATLGKTANFSGRWQNGACPLGRFFVFRVQHVHAPDEGLSILGLRQQQDLLDPLQQQLADGCHLTRETGRLIRDSTEGPPSRWEGKMYTWAARFAQQKCF